MGLQRRRTEGEKKEKEGSREREGKTEKERRVMKRKLEEGQ